MSERLPVMLCTPSKQQRQGFCVHIEKSSKHNIEIFTVPDIPTGLAEASRQGE